MKAKQKCLYCDEVGEPNILRGTGGLNKNGAGEFVCRGHYHIYESATGDIFKIRDILSLYTREVWSLTFTLLNEVNQYRKTDHINKQRFRHPLKPWQDPESLICSPKLGEIVEKEIAPGDECRDKGEEK